MKRPLLLRNSLQKLISCSVFILDTPPSSIESLNVVTSVTNIPSVSIDTTDYSDDFSRLGLHPYSSEPHITVVDGKTRIQDFAPPPDLTSDILLQNEINYQRQKANAQAKTVRLQVDEGTWMIFFKLLINYLSNCTALI